MGDTTATEAEKIEYTRNLNVRNMLETCSINNIDFMVFAAKDKCTLSKAAQISSTIKIQDNGEIKEVDIIALRYRVNYNNYPEFDDEGISCMLSFARKMSMTFVPYKAIFAWKDDSSAFAIDIPILEDNIGSILNREPEVKDKVEPKEIPKSKPTLRIVK